MKRWSLVYGTLCGPAAGVCRVVQDDMEQQHPMRMRKVFVSPLSWHERQTDRQKKKKKQSGWTETVGGPLRRGRTPRRPINESPAKKSFFFQFFSKAAQNRAPPIWCLPAFRCGGIPKVGIEEEEPVTRGGNLYLPHKS